MKPLRISYCHTLLSRFSTLRPANRAWLGPGETFGFFWDIFYSKFRACPGNIRKYFANIRTCTRTWPATPLRDCRIARHGWERSAHPPPLTPTIRPLGGNSVPVRSICKLGLQTQASKGNNSGKKQGESPLRAQRRPRPAEYSRIFSCCANLGIFAENITKVSSRPNRAWVGG